MLKKTAIYVDIAQLLTANSHPEVLSCVMDPQEVQRSGYYAMAGPSDGYYPAVVDAFTGRW